MNKTEGLRLGEAVRRWWLLVLIAAQPLLDVLAYWTQSDSGTLAGWIRLATMVVFCVVFLLQKREKKGRYWLAIGLIALVFGLHCGNLFRLGYMDMAKDINYIAKVIYLPVMAVCLASLMRSEEDIHRAMDALAVSAVLELGILILSVITGTYMYTYTIEQIGISGWVIESNRCCQSDILSSVAVFLAAYSVMSKKSWVKIVLPVLIAAALIVNGTRACYLTLFAVMGGFPVFLLVRALICREKLQNISIFAMAVCCIASVLVYPVTPRHAMSELKKNSFNNNEQLFAQELSDLGYDIYSMSLEEKLSDPIVHEKLATYYRKFVYSSVESLGDNYDIDRIITAFNGTINGEVLGDTRSMKQLNAQFIFEDSDPSIRWTGFEMANFHKANEDLENDWLAVYYYYGYIGIAAAVLAAVFVLLRIALLAVRDFKGCLTVENFALLLCFVLQLGLAYFSGEMLRRPNSSIYLALTAAMIVYRTGKQPAGTAKAGAKG